jgi:hypothetical protein
MGVIFVVLVRFTRRALPGLVLILPAAKARDQRPLEAIGCDNPAAKLPLLTGCAASSLS